MLVADAVPDNADALYRVAEFTADRWPAFRDLKPLLEAIYEDRLEEAFHKLLQVRDNLPTPTANSLFFFSPGLGRVLEGPRTRLLDEVAAGRSARPSLARGAYELEFDSYPGEPLAGQRLERKAVLLDNFRKLYPGRDGDAEEVIEAWLKLGNSTRAGEIISAQRQLAPGNEYWRVALFLSLMSQQRFAEALALASDGGPDLLDPAVFEEAVTMLAEQGSGLPLAGIVTQLQVAASTAVHAGALGDSAGVPGGLRPGTTDLTARGKSPVERLLESLVAGDHEVSRNALREAWRDLWAWRNSPYAPRPGSVSLHWSARSIVNMPLQGRSRRAATALPGGVLPLQGNSPALTAKLRGSTSREDSQERRMLLDAVAAAPFGAEELERYLRAMPQDSRKGFQQLYKYLPKAMDTSKGLDLRLRELSGRLLAQEIDDHSFTLWMLLCDALEMDPGPRKLDAFSRRAAAMVDPSPYQLLLAARVFARAGAVDQAREHYVLVAARRIQHDEYADARPARSQFGSAPPAVSNLATLVDEVIDRLPLEAARQVVDSVLPIARRTGEAPGSAMIFDAFLLSSLERLFPPDELLRQAARRSSSVLEMPEKPVGIGGAKAAEMVRAYARSKNFDRALEILREMLIFPESDVQFPTSLRAQKYRASAIIVQELSKLYGFPFFGNPSGQTGIHFSGLQETYARQDRIFGRHAESWPGAAEWHATIALKVRGWVEGGELSPDQAIQLLMATGRLPIRPEEKAQESDLLPLLIAGIEASEQALSAAGLMVLAPMACAAGNPVPIEWVADLLERGHLNAQQQLAWLRACVHSEDTPKMLGLFQKLGLDKGLEVPKQLLGMAQGAGSTSYARELRHRIQHEEAALRTISAAIY